MAKSWAVPARIRRALPEPLRQPLDDVWQRTRRLLRFRRADVCLVSYPKAGRTWLRLLVGRALTTHFELRTDRFMEVEDLADLDRRIPRILVTHDGIPARPTPEDVEWDKSRYRDKSVILLVRDPRDVVISSYFHVNKRDHTYGGTPAEFVRERRGGIDTVVAFHQSWRDGLRVPRRSVVVRYEDLMDNPDGELARVLGFLDFPDIPPRVIHDAVRYGSFANMQDIERGAAVDVGRLAPVDPSDVDSFKVRRGKVGGYRDYLDAATIALVDEKVSRAQLEAFGY